MKSATGGHLSGPELRRAFRMGFDRLEESRDTVNALNVFPVPDGDTGTNMSLTLGSGMERCPDEGNPTAGEVAGGLAQGTFFGARGNSGVILSQFFKGFSDALQGCESCSGADLALALDKARVAAYGAVGSPREGTMLTVIRRAAEAALEAGGHPDIASVMETAYESSCIALKNTPEQLPVLKEAGVVDSGGLGIVVILGGALEALDPDRALAVTERTGLASVIDTSMLSLGESGQSEELDFVHSSLEEAWGYCTEFIISGNDLDLERVRRDCEEMGRSTVVVGDSLNVRVHVHMEDPGAAISYGVALGTVSKVKIENMDQQNVEWAAGHSEAPRPASVGAPLTVVAVAAGRGLAALFAESGCGHVIEGGQTMNPSVQQIMQGVEHAGADHTIFLPNNKNIVLTAQQVAANDPTVHVVPTHSVPREWRRCWHTTPCRRWRKTWPRWRKRCPPLPPSRSPGPSGIPPSTAFRSGWGTPLPWWTTGWLSPPSRRRLRWSRPLPGRGRAGLHTDGLPRRGRRPGCRRCLRGGARSGYPGPGNRGSLRGPAPLPLPGVHRVGVRKQERPASGGRRFGGPMAIRIVTDSVSDIPPALASANDVTVVPAYVIIGSETYKDGVEITADRFYSRLGGLPRLPTTSQPTIGDFQEVYQRLLWTKATRSSRYTSAPSSVGRSIPPPRPRRQWATRPRSKSWTPSSRRPRGA